MLIFTLTMEILLTIVSFTSLLTFCQAVTVRDENLYEPEPKRYIYPEAQLTPDSLGQDDQQQYYKTAARRSGQIPPPTLQYIIPEDAISEADYNYPSQQPLEARTDNLPPSYEQQVTKRLGATARKPPVEQYLKEVTPTTKTTYNRRAGNYLRSNGQLTVRGNKQRTEETQRNILKQSPFQYVLQSELQQKPQFQPQIQYEVPVQKQIQSQQPDAATLSQYQNALLAHQKVLLESSAGGPEESKSSIYVNHAIPKKPTRKLVKPKQLPVEEDGEYYRQLEQSQQQPQSKQQFFEQQQPAEVMYQAKLEYPKERTNAEEDTTYQHQIRQYQQQILQYQPSAPGQGQVKKGSRRPVKYQQLYQPSQESHNPNFEYQTVTKTVEPVPEHRPTHLRQGPKYLPESKTARYQSLPPEGSGIRYQQVVLPGSQQQQPLISYEAAIAKLQSDQHRPRLPAIRPQQTYRTQEQTGKYQLQYQEESQQDANQEGAEVEYVRPEQTPRLQPTGRALTYRQAFPGSNVRYYRNLPRPVPYPSYE